MSPGKVDKVDAGNWIVHTLVREKKEVTVGEVTAVPAGEATLQQTGTLAHVLFYTLGPQVWLHTQLICMGPPELHVEARRLQDCMLVRAARPQSAAGSQRTSDRFASLCLDYSAELAAATSPSRLLSWAPKLL